jgi:undecaprenyl-diphosphatase
MRFFLLFTLIFSLNLDAAELNRESYWDGLKTSFTYLLKGASLQFQEKNNLAYASVAAPVLWFSFNEDKRISKNARLKTIPKYMQLTSDLSPVLGLPLVSLATYSYGLKNNNSTMIQFAEEYFASLYLAFAESALLSLVYIHERPSTEHLSKVETSFRGKSSFPSGHVIPYATLAFKTFQFYGPYTAILPTALLFLTSVQRVRDGKHYLSDIVGGVFLSAFASEGVRSAAHFSGNDPTYKFIFERNFTVGYVEHEGTVGPKITFDWN